MTREKGDYTGACLPFGLVRSMNSPDPIQIMQNKTYMSLLYEQNTWFKVIPDRRTAASETGRDVVWRFSRQVGWGHAGGRHGEFQRTDQARYDRASA